MSLSSRKDAVYSHFDRYALHYDRNPITRWIGRSKLAVLRGLVPPPPQRDTTRALDFGCGTGRATALLVAEGYRVTGYDRSLGMLAQAQRALGWHRNVVFTADRRTLAEPWPLIVALGVLDYYPNAIPLWQEWRDLLAPDGVLLVTAPNARSPLARLYSVGSIFTSRAYPTTAGVLIAGAQQFGLAVTDVHAAFPRHPVFGHTLVLRLVHADP